MQDSIRIGQVEIMAGKRMTINLPLARLYSHTEMSIPIHVVHGRKSGPRLFLTAAVHGDEINGVEILRRLHRMKLLNRIRGTLILIPIVNIYGFINRSRYLPDRRDLNRSFPGSLKGSLASQLARILMDEIVEHCTHGIDIHTGSNHRNNLPQIRACLDDLETKRFALAFGSPVILDARLRDGSLREAVTEKGIPMLLYEAGEALRFDEGSIRRGLKGIISAMREIGLLPQVSVSRPLSEPLIAKSTKWVRAPMSGIFSQGVKLGKAVKEDDLIGYIEDPVSDHAEPVLSPKNGVVISRSNLPLVHRGDAIFQIASVEDAAPVDFTLPDLEDEVDDPFQGPNQLPL